MKLELPLGQDSEAERMVCEALLPEIERIYSRFLFREPTSQEVARHLGCFYQKFPTLNDRQKAVRTGNIRPHLGIRPLIMETDLTNQCNIRCVFCHFSTEHYSKQKRDDISVEDFTRIAEQVFPICYDVNLSQMAEPLLHRQFGELLKITSSYSVPRIGMTTNGLLFSEETIEQMIIGRMDNVSISIDGATKSTYERIRRKGNFDRLIANVRAINRIKQRYASRTPRLLFAVVMMRSNISELPALVQLAHELDVPTVQANHLHSFEGLVEDEVMSSAPDLCHRMMDEALALAEKYQIELRLPARFERPATPGPLLEIGMSALAQNHLPSVVDQSSPVDPSVFQRERRREISFFDFPLNALYGNEDKDHCLWPWHFFVISRYGDVIPCGGWIEEPMGNIFHEQFEEIWNNDRYRALRSGLMNRVLGRSCQTCPVQMMGNVNREDAFIRGV